MGKYDEYLIHQQRQSGELLDHKSLSLFFWLCKIANELAEQNRLIRQEQSTKPGEYIPRDANVDKA